jgi:murein DD-endopeptidase MepM/ murein hydrolase activator NlpD
VRAASDRRPRRSRLIAGLGLLALGAAAPTAIAGRPPEALDAEVRAQAAELDYLVRKVDALSSSLVERRTHLRQRLREMYKLSQGGYLRLLLGADSPVELFSRRDAARRILQRDLDELAAVREELAELGGLREQLRDGERRAKELAEEARDSVPTDLARKDALYRPVGGAVVEGFGPYLDAETGIELSRDGVELAARAGEPVRAPADGEVRSVGELPGLGLTIVIYHGGGWATLLGRLGSTGVSVGQSVGAGERLAEAAGPTLHFELSQGGAWLDPAAWLARDPHHHDHRGADAHRSVRADRPERPVDPSAHPPAHRAHR